MNPRVLELLKNPKNIQSEDLNLLKEEIHAFPYVQNIRALHLYGVHLYDQENYQKELSTTAAYTTDKKILYQLINGKIRPDAKPAETVEEKQPSQSAAKPARFGYKDKAFPIKREEPVEKTEEKQDETAACMLNIPQEVTHIYVNGERNRILFEGEENFLNEEQAETIDLESTLESGTLVTQKTELVSKPISLIQETIQEEQGNTAKIPEADTEFTPEEIVNEDQLADTTEKEEVAQEDHLSFHEVEPLEEIVNEEVVEELKENASETQKEQTEEADMGAVFTPEVIISEEQPSEEVTEEINEMNDTSFHEAEPLSPETDQKEVHIAEEIQPETEQADEAEISFHGTEAFMSDVKIQTANTEEMLTAEAVVKPSINKHEEEMRRLIEEVEKKMKETKPAAENVAEETESEAGDHEISFAETQNFHFWSTGSDEPKFKEERKAEAAVENIAEHQEPEQPAETHEEEAAEPETLPEINTEWKPMSVDTHVPDSLISKQTVSPEVKAEDIEPEAVQTAKEEQEDAKEEIAVAENAIEAEVNQNDKKEALEKADNEEENHEIISPEEAPVMSVSFFGSGISSWSGGENKNEAEKKEEEPAKNTEPEQPAQVVHDSNVPGFINTWQSWLKIDRTEEIEKEKTVIKEKAIETFIENNPRISQLKEESTYVVKERNDDISHLMTETLANLYVEQKLYSKAIKAFGILKKKHPEKAEYFDARIKDVNDIKSGK